MDRCGDRYQQKTEKCRAPDHVMAHKKMSTANGIAPLRGKYMDVKITIACLTE